MKPDNALTIEYLAKHPDNAARVIENLPYSMAADLFGQLSPDTYLPTIEKLMPAYAAGLLDRLPEESGSKLIHALADDQLSILLTFLDDVTRKKMLTQMSSGKRKNIIKRTQFPENSVGSIMMPPTLTLPQDISVADALKRVKQNRHFHFSEVIVLDKALHYIGMISLNKLIQTSPQRKLSSIIQYTFPSLSARKSLQNLTENPAWSHVRVLPVTDGRELLIGVLDYATLLQHNMMAAPVAPSQQTRQSSALEFLFQTLATLIEALVDKLFPLYKTNLTRDRQT